MFRGLKLPIDKEDFLPVRNIIAAMWGQVNNEPTSFDLRTLTAKEHNAAIDIMNFCFKWRYFPWSMEKYQSAIGIAEYYYKNKRLPQIPHVLSIDSITVAMSLISQAISINNFDTVSKEFKELIIHTIKKEKSKIKINSKNFSWADFLDKSQYTDIWNNQGELTEEGEVAKEYYTQELNLLKKEHAYLMTIYNFLLARFEKNEVPARLSQKLAHQQKQIDNPLYTGVRDIWSRIYGLMLWETRNEIALEQGFSSMSEKEGEKLFNSITTSQLYQRLRGIKELSATQAQKIEEKNNVKHLNRNKSEETFLTKILEEKHKDSNKLDEPRNLQRWLKSTDMSIRQGSFWVNPRKLKK